MQLDDFGGVEERRRNLCETHHQHRTDRKVRGDQQIARGKRRLERRHVIVGKSGRANYGMGTSSSDDWQRSNVNRGFCFG